MKEIYTQIDLYSKRNEIRSEIKPIAFESGAKRYLKNTFKKNKKSIIILWIIIFLVSFIEISIPLFLNVFIENFAYQLDLKNLYSAIGVLCLVLIFYIYLSYVGIERQKQIILDVINQIREDWLRIYISKSHLQFTDRDKGNLYVKITYHLSLLQTGLQNSFFVFFQWIIFLFGILIVSAILDIKLLLISLAFVPINALVFFIGYIFSAYYLAKDQTLYSKLLRYISDTFNSFSFIKAHKKEEEFLQNVDNIVKIDNHFRIKREIVLNLGNKIIFVLLTLISIAVYILHIYAPFLMFDSLLQSVTTALVFALHLKLIYLTMRMGLFYFPLKLGLFLTIPSLYKKNISQKVKRIESFSLSARKVKLRKHTQYQKNISFNFEKGKTYLIEDLNGDSKDKILHIMAGIASKYIGKPWVFKLNKKSRLLYSSWMQNNKNIYYINAHMYNQVTFYDFLNHPAHIEYLKKFEVFNFIFESKKFLAHKITFETVSFKELCLLQIAYTLLQKPELIIVDSIIQDMLYPEIKKALDIVREELPDSIYVAGTHFKKENTNFDVIYKI